MAKKIAKNRIKVKMDGYQAAELFNSWFSPNPAEEKQTFAQRMDANELGEMVLTMHDVIKKLFFHVAHSAICCNHADLNPECHSCGIKGSDEYNWAKWFLDKSRPFELSDVKMRLQQALSHETHEDDKRDLVQAALEIIDKIERQDNQQVSARCN